MPRWKRNCVQWCGVCSEQAGEICVGQGISANDWQYHSVAVRRRSIDCLYIQKFESRSVHTRELDFSGW